MYLHIITNNTYTYVLHLRQAVMRKEIKTGRPPFSGKALRFVSKSHYNDVIMTKIASQITSLTVVYSTVYWEADQRKHQSSASLAFVWGIHRDRWIPRTKGQLRGKCFHLMTSSWIWRRSPCGALASQFGKQCTFTDLLENTKISHSKTISHFVQTPVREKDPINEPREWALSGFVQS